MIRLDKRFPCGSWRKARGVVQSGRVLEFRAVDVSLNGLKSVLPFRAQLRSQKRALVPYRSTPKNDEGLLAQSLRMVNALRKASISLAGKTVVEIGTGWIPILPMVFHLAGAERVITVDQERLMDRSTFRHGANFIRQNLARECERLEIDSSLLSEDRVPATFGGNLRQMCDAFGIDYVAPSDFLALGQGRSDFIVSRTVLEHIPPELLKAIFRHSHNVLRPGGTLCHSIDMSDHNEHVNHSISRLDFLRYDDVEWAKRAKDPLHYQNRLRLSDFEKLFSDTGWNIVSATREPNPRALRELGTLQIDKRFSSKSPEDLATLTSIVIATNFL